MNLKKTGKVFCWNRLMKKIIYRAAVSQRLTNTILAYYTHLGYTV